MATYVTGSVKLACSYTTRWDSPRISAGLGDVGRVRGAPEVPVGLLRAQATQTDGSAAPFA